MLKFIESLIPLIIGVVILISPRVLTKKDLNKEENSALKKKLRLIGVFMVIAGVLIFLKNLL